MDDRPDGLVDASNLEGRPFVVERTGASYLVLRAQGGKETFYVAAGSDGELYVSTQVDPD